MKPVDRSRKYSPPFTVRFRSTYSCCLFSHCWSWLLHPATSWLGYRGSILYFCLFFVYCKLPRAFDRIYISSSSIKSISLWVIQMNLKVERDDISLLNGQSEAAIALLGYYHWKKEHEWSDAAEMHTQPGAMGLLCLLCVSTSNFYLFQWIQAKMSTSEGNVYE